MTTTPGRSPINWASLSQRITAWVFGPGMLRFHATVYFTLMTLLLLWNMARNPSDIWAMDLLRRWGAILAFHAVLLGGGWAAMRLLRIEMPGTRPRDADLPVALPPGPPSRLPWPPAPAKPASTWPGTRTAGAAGGHRSVAMARWTRDAVAGASARFNQARANRHGDPTTTWPSSGPNTRTPEDAEFVARFGPTGVDSGLHPTSPGSHGPAGAAVSHQIKERRWSWVEAAAGSLLPRKDESIPFSPAPASGSAAETTPFPETGRPAPPPTTNGGADSSAGLS